MATAERDARVAFFLQHAGWSHAAGASTGEQALARVECAEELARAEEQMGPRGWYVAIHDDTDGPMEDDVDSVGMVERGEAVCLLVYLHDEDGRILASLHDIVVTSANSPYLRVVAAELAAELLATHAECHARTTCGACGNAWCERCDPAPSSLCHWCHGRGSSTAAMDAVYEDGRVTR